MSDSTDAVDSTDAAEAEGIGAADPITGVVAGGDDLASDPQLPDSDVEDGDAAATIRAESNSITTNDALAGETVYPGEGDGNDGPTGGAPRETTPDEPENAIDPASIDLADER
jgi:hypothetical protein